jgi:hypothetical protein
MQYEGLFQDMEWVRLRQEMPPSIPKPRKPWRNCLPPLVVSLTSGGKGDDIQGNVDPLWGACHPIRRIRRPHLYARELPNRLSGGERRFKDLIVLIGLQPLGHKVMDAMRRQRPPLVRAKTGLSLQAMLGLEVPQDRLERVTRQTDQIKLGVLALWTKSV